MSRELPYVFSVEEAVQWNASRLNTWAYFTPQEYERHNAAAQYVGRIEATTDALSEGLAPHAEQAQRTLDDALATKNKATY